MTPLVPSIGRIITFYSFKGGVGRSMALANMALILANATRSNMRPILMMDWDLEAPGLHRYFPDTPADVPGLLDLMINIQSDLPKRASKTVEKLRREAEKIIKDVVLAEYVGTTGKDGLFLMSSGRRTPQYQTNLRTFDWEALHQRNPYLLLELGKRLRAEYSWVLIDSRTGYTDTSAICTAILPDSVAGIFVPNRQSIDGLIEVMQAAIRYRDSLGFSSLQFYPVPSRIEFGRDDLHKDWRFGKKGMDQGYQAIFADFYDIYLGITAPNLEDYFNAVCIPHGSDYAYGERIAVDENKSETSLSGAYRRLGDWVLKSFQPCWPLYINRLHALCAEARAAIEGADTLTPLPTPLLQLKPLVSELLLPKIGQDEQIYASEVLSAYLDVLNALLETEKANARTPELADLIDQGVAVACAFCDKAPPEVLSDFSAALETLVAQLKQKSLFDSLTRLEEQWAKAVERAFGPDHPATLARKTALAAVHFAQGKYPDARMLQEQVLEARRRLLGSEHPDTLICMNNLALSLYAQGDLPGARALQEQALALVSHHPALGSEHSTTLDGLDNLGGILLAQGDLPGARALLEQVLEARRRILGPEHHDTLTSLNNLAETLRAQGDLPGARALQEQVLETRRRTLGPEHPDTLTSMNNLAGTLSAQGELSGARALEEQVLDARRRLLGAEHPTTFTSMNNLALTLYDQGDLPGARALQEQVLEARRRILGPGHPETLICMGNLALTLRAQGDLPGARALQEQVVEASRRLLGLEHPATLTSLNNLAGTLADEGDLPGARALEEQVLEFRRRLLGPEHPATLTSLNNLASTLSDQGDLPGARALQEQVLEICRRTLGPEHPHTLINMGNLAGTLGAQGDLSGARALQEQVLEARRRILGPEHPDTLTGMSNLSAVLADLGDLPAARALLEEAQAGLRRMFGPQHRDTLEATLRLLKLLSDMGEDMPLKDLLGTLIQELPSTTLKDVFKQIGF